MSRTLGRLMPSADLGLLADFVTIVGIATATDTLAVRVCTSGAQHPAAP